MRKQPKQSIVPYLLERLAVGFGSIVLTLAFFLLLPVLQAIAKSPTADLSLRSVDAAALPPPPPPPPEEEVEDEPEPEEQPPEMMEQNLPLDLSQLELALNPGLGGDGWLEGGLSVNLDSISGNENVQALFSLNELDQRPRATYQPNPILTAKLRKKAPGTVVVIFIVDERGRVKTPKVQSSSDPIFERPAITAIKQWRFEPGKRNGKPVQFPMRVPITFPKS